MPVIELTRQRELRLRWAKFAIPLVEAVGWLGFPVALDFDPLLSFARALEKLREKGKGARVRRIWRLLAADEDEGLDLSEQLERTRPALGALLGPDGGPVAVEPFLEFIGATCEHLATHPTSEVQRREIDSLVQDALRQVSEVTRIDGGEAVWREQGRCIGCGARLLTWFEGDGTSARATERGKRHVEKRGQVLARRERAEYCCDSCKRAHQQARHRGSRRARGG